MRLVIGIGLALGAAAAPGCKSHKAETPDLAATIQQRVAELGLPTAGVTCPKDVALAPGAVFTCSVDIGGKPYELEATVQDAEPDGKRADVSLSTRWKQGDAVVAAKLAPRLSAGMSKAIGTPVTVTCGDALRFLTPDRTIRCELTAGTTKAGLITTFDDKLDPTTWKLDPPMLQKATLEQILVPAVRSKTAPDAVVTCGSEPLIPRPSSGIVPCTASVGGKQAQLAVTVDDKLQVQRWEVAP